MRKGRLVILLIIVVILATIGYRGWQIMAEKKAQQPVSQAEEAIPVRVETVQLADIQEELSFTGNIRPKLEVKIFSKVSGRLEELLVDKGDTVTQGENLAIIDHEEIEARVKQAEASLAVAQAQLEQVKAELEQIASDRDRITTLYKQGVASKQDFDSVEARYKASVAQQQLTGAQINMTKASLEQDRIRLNESTIVSPLEGVVAEKYLEPGDMVMLATPLLSVVNMETVKVLINVEDKLLTRIQPGTKTTVTVDTYPEKEFEGQVSKISPTIDPLTRTVEVEILIANPAQQLKPGMFARVKIIVAQHSQVPVIPDSAILRDQAGSYVYTVNNQKAKRVSVKLGLSQGARVEVSQGLKPGDLLIIAGQHNVSEDSKVSIVK